MENSKTKAFVTKREAMTEIWNKQSTLQCYMYRGTSSKRFNMKVNIVPIIRYFSLFDLKTKKHQCAYISVLVKMSHIMRLWQVSSSVNSFFKRARAAIQQG